MDIASLQAFRAVAETGSFTAAAERLFLTQPAVSKRIAQLEEQLGARLFDRIGRQIRLTEAGRALLPRTRRIMLELDDMTRAIRDLSGDVSGSLVLGTSHHIGLHRLPPVLREYSRRWPRVQLDIDFIDSEEAWEGVLQGDLELGVVTLPPEHDPRADAEVIWRDPLAFVVSPEHALAREAAVTLPMLTAWPALLPSPATFTRRIVEALFRERQLTLNISMSTNYLETIRMMVSIGLGWSVLPASMLDADLVRLPIEAPAMARQLGVVTHPQRTLSNAARHFLEILREHADPR